MTTKTFKTLNLVTGKSEEYEAEVMSLVQETWQAWTTDTPRAQVSVQLDIAEYDDWMTMVCTAQTGSRRVTASTPEAAFGKLGVRPEKLIKSTKLV